MRKDDVDAYLVGKIPAIELWYSCQLGYGLQVHDYIETICVLDFRMLLAGILPFGAMFIELFFIFTVSVCVMSCSMWSSSNSQ